MWEPAIGKKFIVLHHDPRNGKDVGECYAVSDGRLYLRFSDGYTEGFKREALVEQDEQKQRFTENANKPPLGVLPEKLWLLLRCQELSRAIHDNLRVDNIKYDSVYNWLDELQEHLKELSGK